MEHSRGSQSRAPPPLSQGCLGCASWACSAASAEFRPQRGRGCDEIYTSHPSVHQSFLSFFTNMREQILARVGFESNHGCRPTTMTITSRALPLEPVTSTAYSQRCHAYASWPCSAASLGAFAADVCAVTFFFPGASGVLVGHSCPVRAV